MQKKKLEKLENLADAFGPLKRKVVFCGGAVTALYSTSLGSREHRSHGEIECIVDTPTMAEFIYFDQQIRDRGFTPRYDPSPPVTKWDYKGIALDLLPVHAEILRLQSSRWFEEGVFHAINHPLSTGRSIRLMQAPYFLATKIESFINKGKSNFRKSKDFEDIVYLLDCREEIVDEIAASFYEVRGYIQEHIRSMLSHDGLEEALYYALPFHAGHEGVEKIIDIMKIISENAYEMA